MPEGSRQVRGPELRQADADPDGEDGRAEREHQQEGAARHLAEDRHREIGWAAVTEEVRRLVEVDVEAAGEELRLAGSVAGGHQLLEAPREDLFLRGLSFLELRVGHA